MGITTVGNRKWNRLRCLAALSMIVTSCFAAAERASGAPTPLLIYVDAAAPAGGTGTLSSPYNNINQAKNRIRLLARPLSSNVEVRLRAGVYRLSGVFPFTLDTAMDSGDALHSITYTSYNDEEVLISGARPNVVDWSGGAGGLTADGRGRYWGGWTDSTWTYRDVYFNGRRLTPARYPNEGQVLISQRSNPNSVDPGAWTSFIMSQDIPLIAANENEAEMVVRRRFISPRQKMFGPTSVRNVYTQADLGMTGEDQIGTARVLRHCEISVRGVTDLLNVVSGGYCACPCYEAYPGDRAYFERAASFNDAVDEWYLHPRAGTAQNRSLNVILPVAQSPTGPGSGTTVVPHLPQLVVVRGTPAARITNVHFVGLNFAFDNAPLPSQNGNLANGHGYAPFQAGHGGDNKPILSGMIELYEVADCSIENCRVGHTSANGIMVHGDRINVIRNEIFDVAGTAVHVGGFGTAGYAPPISNDIIISDNKIHNFGMTYEDSAGIFVWFSTNVLIEHNEIAFGGWSGVSVGWSWDEYAASPDVSNIYLLRNNIHHVMGDLSESGAVYLNGRVGGAGGLLQGNWVHDIRKDPNINTDYPCAGLFWDSGAGYDVFENVVETTHTPVHFNPSGGAALQSSWGDNYFLYNQRTVDQCQGGSGIPDLYVREIANVRGSRDATRIMGEAGPRTPSSAGHTLMHGP